MTEVREATPVDAGAWLRMRRALWPDEAEPGEHEREVAAHFAGEGTRAPWTVLLAERDGQLVGFVELSIRPCAEGCRTNRVAYLEGWYVEPRARGTGAGRALVEAAARWGRANGCREFASDADPENAQGVAAHRAVGFEDVGLVRCFRREL